MKRSGSRPTLVLFIVLGVGLWAASISDAAPAPKARTMSRQFAPALTEPRSTTEPQLPAPVPFREVKGRGLLVNAWLNGGGPYTFAVDTGAGITLVGEQIAAEVKIPYNGDSVSLGGLSGVTGRARGQGVVRTLALGDSSNLLPDNRKVLVTRNLPPGIDGILDPTEAYFPFGYSINIPDREMEAFNPKTTPLSLREPPPNGTVVHWASGPADRRPFVKLGDGRLALLDTGSGFGLAVSQEYEGGNRSKATMHDINGATVSSRRVQPTTVSIGSLTLRGVPTDILFGVEKGSPILLGREALDPFKLVFDPVNHLIAIQPTSR